MAAAETKALTAIGSVMMAAAAAAVAVVVAVVVVFHCFGDLVLADFARIARKI